MDDLILYWAWLIAIVIMDINDIIRGPWFYHSIWAIILWNALGIATLRVLIFRYKERGG